MLSYSNFLVILASRADRRSPRLQVFPKDDPLKKLDLV
jgi:hypothetical protein